MFQDTYMSTIKPYTYVIVHRQTGYYYFGVRYSNKMTPEKDLGKVYFTSSNTVRTIIEAEGLDAFEWHVRRVFDSKEEACQHEYTVVRRIYRRDKCLNKCPSPKGTPGHWFTNGTQNVLGKYCPTGFVPGRSGVGTDRMVAARVRNKHRRWWNNGQKSIFIEFSPGPTWLPGRAKGECNCPNGHPRLLGKLWWNDGTSNFRGVEPPDPSWSRGRLPFPRQLTKRIRTNEERSHQSKMMSGRTWWNDGTIERISRDPLEGFTPGRINQPK